MSATNSAVVDLFKAQYEKLAGKVHVAANVDEAIQAVHQILTNSNVTRVVAAPLADELSGKLHKMVETVGLATVSMDLTSPSVQYQINEADVGISMAEFGIASMGAIVEVSSEDSYRLVSSLPLIHIAFVPAAEIIETLDEAGPRLRDIYRRYQSNCHITFISGPSRTADIEMKLFLGVHGPQASHVVVCNW
ncbi:MAG: lactate utilization protein C [bacterium]